MSVKWKEAALMLRKDEDLSARTSLGTGGKAWYFAEPRSFGELRSLMEEAAGTALRISVLGSGTRTIIPDEGVEGLVVSTRALCRLRCKGAVVSCGPGDSLDSLINFSIDSKLTGLEGLGGYPGTAGGALALDAEANGTRLRDSLLYAEFLAKGGKFLRRKGSHFHIEEGEILTGLSFRLRPTEYTAEARMRKESFTAFVPPCPRCIGPVFRNPDAGEMLERHGLLGRNGSLAEFSASCPGYILAFPSCSSREVLELIGKAERAVPSLVRAVTVLGAE